MARLISHNISGRDDAFHHGVRQRDRKSVITGARNLAAQWGIWAGFEAAHVFPLEHESIWVAKNYSRWITDMDTVGISKINSVQNGLLIEDNLHASFD